MPCYRLFTLLTSSEHYKSVKRIGSRSGPMSQLLVVRDEIHRNGVVMGPGRA